MNSRRQFEINEWYNYDKLETLFFLQVVFMASLAIAIVMFWTKKGMITVGLAGVLYGILGLGVVGIGLYKYFYTEGARDVKLWHRRRFQSTPAPPPPPICPPATGSNAISDAMDYAMQLELKAEKCGNNINQGLTNITMGAANQVSAMQSGQTNLLQQLGATGGAALGVVCGKT